MPIQRSRGGCHNCKRRKRKCDEARPQCLACQSRGDTCAGYNLQLKWNSSRVSPSHSSNISDGPMRKPGDLSGHNPSGSASTISTQDSPPEIMPEVPSGSTSIVEREAFARCSYSLIYMSHNTRHVLCVSNNLKF
jgi:hypothetical protein